MRAAANSLDLGGRPLLVEHAGSGRHPLRIAAVQEAVVAERIAMLQITFEYVGDCLKAAMRVPRRACSFPRRELDGPHVIEEQERIDVGQCCRREGPADDESVALDGALSWNEAGDRSGGGRHCGSFVAYTTIVLTIYSMDHRPSNRMRDNDR